jgi:uncharacterized membrane protein
LSTLSTNQRLKTALGGFISFTGFIILAIVILTSTNAVDIKSIFQNEVMVGAVAFLGLLDVLCGVFLISREKTLKELFSSQKNKTNEDVK